MISRNCLEWIDENQKTHRVQVVDRIFVGRDCVGIDETKRIIVDSPKVSRDHAVIKFDGSCLQIIDMSKNGTWINDVRMAPGSFQELENDDVIKVAEFLIRVSCDTAASNEIDERLASGTTIVDSRRMEVTNVVADVREFSGISQIEDSSLVYAAMKEIFSTFSAIVHDFKGTVKDYAGDAIFAYWDHYSAPGKDQAVLACQAAIKQCQALGDIRVELSETSPAVGCLRMGWGITTGSVTMSHYETKVADLALVGDCVNLAFRLSGIANKEVSDKIVVCSHTADLVREVLPIVDLELNAIRGRSGKVHIFGIRI